MSALSPSPFDLSGRRILIAGAAGGIGAATARLCAQLGAHILLVDILEAAIVRQRIGEAADDVPIYRIDTSDRAAVDRLASEVGIVYGLVDAAAICPDGDWLDDGWDAVLEKTLTVNIKGPLNLTRAFFPKMIERGEGRIVLCGSVAGWMGGIRSGPHYAFTKGGIHAFIRWLSTRGAPHNVLVNGIAPGAIDTGMIRGKGYDPERYPMKRLGEPAEIAAAAAFLMGPGASYASGAILDINGGVFFH